MGSEFFLKLLPKIFNVLAWPSFTLLYPLYASIRVIESDSYSKNQQCLTYWVLFSLIKILELALAKLFEWLPFWPYAKGIATFLLVIPYFGGASYVYKHFIRPFISVDSQICTILFIPRKKGFTLSKQNDFLDAAERYIKENGLEALDKVGNCTGKFESNFDATELDLTRPTSPKKFQKEWSCALCLVSTTSEKCLKKHLHGKKHKAKEKELRANKLGNKTVVKSSSPLKRTDRMVLHENFNQIKWVSLEKWSDLLSPVARSIIWCRWKRPEFGWTKLNTDGSVNRDNAGFGGLLRDYKGDPICAYVSKAPQDDIFLVEQWAIWRGLVLALGLGIKIIWVESDSMSVVKTINREQSYSQKAGSCCLKHIWELLKKFEKYKVSHSWRETNRAADHLAKMDILGSDVVLWPVDFPDSLCNIIKDDAKGKRYRRG